MSIRTPHLGHALSIFLLGFAASVWSAPRAPALQSTIHQWTNLPQTDEHLVAFEAVDRAGPARRGHAGMLPLGTRGYASPGFPAALWGGCFTWSQDGALLTYASGTLGSTTILDPAGAPIRDVRGATLLASAHDVMVELATGNIFAVTLYSGLVFWTPTHVYLLLVGGVPTVYEVTFGGAPIAGARAVSRLAAQVLDLDPSPFVTSSLLVSGALIATDTKLVLMTTAGTIATSEVLAGGSSIGGIQGLLPMGGSATLVSLSAAAYAWNAGHVYRVLASGGVTTTELFTPSGAPIAGAWGLARQVEPWNGSGAYRDAITIFTPERQWFENTLGPIPVQEVLEPSSTSITSGVSLAPKHDTLLQSGALMAQFGTATLAGRATAGGIVVAGRP